MAVLASYSFISTKYRRGATLAIFTFLLAFVVIMLGAYTRLTDAGLSCPDWPHCYGFMTAPYTLEQIQQAAQAYPMMPVNVKKAWTEMVHRYFAGTEGILILILVGSFLFTRKAKDTKTIIISMTLLGLLGVQVMLGMLTVTAKLKPVIVLSHLLTGISILSVLWWAYLDLFVTDDSFLKKQNSTRVIPWCWLGFFIIAAQITLGGWVSTHYAGLACVDFPYCNGKILPTMQWNNLNSDLITIHMLHRIGAMITAIYLGILGLCLLRSATFRAIGIIILMLIGLQITLGILNIVWLRPVWIAMIHQAVAILLLLTLIMALVKSYFVTRDKRHGTSIA